MNLFKKSVIFLAIIMLFGPVAVFGQFQHDMQLRPFFKYFKDARRYELGFSMVNVAGYFQGVSQVTTGSYVGDTTVKRDIATTSGFGGFLGLSLPFKATGHISCWAATCALGVNMYTWSELNNFYGPDGSLYTPTNGTPLSAGTMQIVAPLGIDWKVGNDAICSKRLAFGASFGAGFIPSMHMTSLTGVSGYPTGYRFGCTPFIKAEGSVFLGIDVKVRALYTMGDVSHIEVNGPIPGSTDGPFKIVSQSSVWVSLIFMPFSGGWRETNWWNTYDTYNEKDRFN